MPPPRPPAHAAVDGYATWQFGNPWPCVAQSARHRSDAKWTPAGGGGGCSLVTFAAFYSTNRHRATAHRRRLPGRAVCCVLCCAAEERDKVVSPLLLCKFMGFLGVPNHLREQRDLR